MDENALRHMRQRNRQWEELREGMLSRGYKRVPLRGEDYIDISGNGLNPALWLRPVHNGSARGMVILCAGGAFKYKTAREVIPTDEFYYNRGFNTAILDYTVSGEAERVSNDSIEIRLAAGDEALLAVEYVRKNAEGLNTKPDKIALAGYSAGGIACQYAATRFNEMNRPDAVLLLYGAFSKTTRVFGTDYNAEAYRETAKYDPLRNIRSDCPPVFIFQTNADDPRNGLLFALELANRGIPHEIHTFTNGSHGGAMFNGECESRLIPHTSKWAELSAEWLEELGF